MKYVVSIPEVHYVEVIVDADSEDNARKVANEAISQFDKLKSEYSHTFDEDEWNVQELNDIHTGLLGFYKLNGDKVEYLEEKWN